MVRATNMDQGVGLIPFDRISLVAGMSTITSIRSLSLGAGSEDTAVKSNSTRAIMHVGRATGIDWMLAPLLPGGLQ